MRVRKDRRRSASATHRFVGASGRPLSRQSLLQVFEEFFCLLKLSDYLGITLHLRQGCPWVSTQRVAQLIDIAEKARSLFASRCWAEFLKGRFNGATLVEELV